MLRCVKLGVVTSIVTLTSCSYIYGDNGIIQNRDADYLKATTTPPLRIPPGLSSSTIEAHYPVPDRSYPSSAKTVDLTPPELAKPFVMPDLRPVKGAQPNIASEHAPATPNESAFKKNLPNSYYDPYTRASATPAGIPIGDVFKAIWPWGNSSNSSSSASSGQQASANKSSGFSWSSLWPWSKKDSQPTAATSTPATSSAQQQPVQEQEAENNTSAAPEQKRTMPPTMYYDRYSQR